ncbi:MAG: SCO family protein [Actinobacteria bacterium]|nr:SCO family protein [Actinomycetota bacterium]
MTRGRTLLAWVAVLASLLLGACTSGSASTGSSASSTGSELNDRSTSGKYAGFGLDPAQPRPNFVLTDTSGQQYSFAQLTAGRPTFLYFGYTHCPDVCPTTMADIGQALLAVPPDVRAKTLVVFVTTDPAEDTGPVIASWLKAFSIPNYTGFVGLTGSQAAINAAQAAAKVPIATDEGKTHSAQVFLYGLDDYAHVAYVQSNNETDQMKHDLPLVAAGK